MRFRAGTFLFAAWLSSAGCIPPNTQPKSTYSPAPAPPSVTSGPSSLGLVLGGGGSSTGGLCTPLPFIVGGPSQPSVAPGGTYRISCDYGRQVDSIGPGGSASQCAFKGFSGTAAQFDCVAPSQKGSVPLACMLVSGTPSNTCAQTNPVAAMNVNALGMLSSIRSVTLYNGVTTETSNLPQFRERLRNIKDLGFNTVWWVVPWQFVEPKVGSSPDSPIGTSGSELNSAALQEIRDGLAAIKASGLNLIWSFDYLGIGWSPVGADPIRLAYGKNRYFLQRYATYAAKLVAEAQMLPSTLFMIHDEGILAPYDTTRNDATPGGFDIQASYRSFLFTRNSELAYWNTRWGTHYADWGAIRTFSFNTDGYSNPELQDTVGFINWNIASGFGDGSFAKALKTSVPGISLGFHYTNFSMLDTRTDGYLSLDKPLRDNHGFDFVSLGIYDANPSEYPFRQEARAKVAAIKKLFGSLPVFYGEHGSAVCTPGDSDCPLRPGGTGAGQLIAASDRFLGRQAQYVARNAVDLIHDGIGFNLWGLHDFPSDSTQGLFGLTDSDGKLKPAGAFMRTVLLQPAGQGDPPGTIIRGILTLTAARVVVDFDPWAISIEGSGFRAESVAMVFAGGKLWSKAIPVTLSSDQKWVSFQLESKQAPGGCNAGKTCSLSIVIWHPSLGVFSAPILATMPAAPVP